MALVSGSPAQAEGPSSFGGAAGMGRTSTGRPAGRQTLPSGPRLWPGRVGGKWQWKWAKGAGPGGARGRLGWRLPWPETADSGCPGREGREGHKGHEGCGRRYCATRRGAGRGRALSPRMPSRCVVGRDLAAGRSGAGPTHPLPCPVPPSAPSQVADGGWRGAVNALSSSARNTR